MTKEKTSAHGRDHEVNTLLWATDFSKESRNCLPYVKVFSNTLHTQNYAIYVLPRFSDWIYETAFVPKEELMVSVEKTREKSAANLLKAVRRTHIEFETRITEGIASTEIIEFATQNRVDMIFVGRRGDSEIEHILIGSTTSRLTRNSAVPVFVVPRAVRNVQIERILCPIDFSEYSMKELDFAISLAKQFNAKLFVAHISEFFNYKIPVFNRDKLLEKINEKIEKTGEAHQYKIENFIFELGEPAKKILEIARTNKVNVITMTTHQRKGIEKLFLGSIAEKVLMYSDIPVIILPPDRHG
ncbi:MAG: universal stress protein [Candidatus Omnitrophota bacterium]